MLLLSGEGGLAAGKAVQEAIKKQMEESLVQWQKVKRRTSVQASNYLLRVCCSVTASSVLVLLLGANKPVHMFILYVCMHIFTHMQLICSLPCGCVLFFIGCLYF